MCESCFGDQDSPIARKIEKMNKKPIFSIKRGDVLDKDFLGVRHTAIYQGRDRIVEVHDGDWFNGVNGFGVIPCPCDIRVYLSNLTEDFDRN